MTVLGVHTPETEAEKSVDALKKKLKAEKIEYPIAVDANAKTWAAWGNQFWPSVYLIDKAGTVRYRWDGELNWKEIKGEAVMRKKIEELMAEKDPKR